MGWPKATLPFGPETMLMRVVRILGDIVQPIVVVAAPDQQLPRLPAQIIIARDQREARGPLEGMLAGLSAIAPHAASAYVTSCDVPLLIPAFVHRLIALLEDQEIVVPVDGQFHHPLAAVYRTEVIPRIESLLATNQFRPIFLFDLSKTRRVHVGDLRAVDPALDSLRNLNHPDDYLAALSTTGFAAPPDVLAELQKNSE